MTKNSKVGLIAGIAVVGVGAFFLVKALMGGKKDIIVQYSGLSDESAAKVVRDAIKPKDFVHGYVDPLSTVKDMVVVGAGQINPVWSILQENGVFPAITEGQAGTGFIFVRQAFGHTFYGVGGYLAADTLKAANYIKALGALPTVDIQV